MQLQEGGKESSTTIFSSSTDLNLLKLTAKLHLCYARNKNSLMNQTTKEKKQIWTLDFECSRKTNGYRDSPESETPDGTEFPQKN